MLIIFFPLIGTLGLFIWSCNQNVNPGCSFPANDLHLPQMQIPVPEKMSAGIDLLANALFPCWKQRHWLSILLFLWPCGTNSWIWCCGSEQWGEKLICAVNNLIANHLENVNCRGEMSLLAEGRLCHLSDSPHWRSWKFLCGIINK